MNSLVLHLGQRWAKWVPQLYHHHHLLSKQIRISIQKLQIRGVRGRGGESSSHKEGSEEHDSKTKDADESVSSSSTKFKSNDPEAIRQEFEKHFKKFIKDFKSLKMKQSKNGAKTDFQELLKNFVENFNKQLDDKKIVIPDSIEIARQFRIFLLITSLFIASLTLMWMNRPGQKIDVEHQKILSQRPISYESFIKEYLSTGEVKMIFLYPLQHSAVAILHSGAVINGQPFDGIGVHFRLDLNPVQFHQQLRDEQQHLGIDTREHVSLAMPVNGSPTSMLLFTLGCILLLVYGFRYWRGTLRKKLFKVEPKNGEKTSTD